MIKPGFDRLKPEYEMVRFCSVKIRVVSTLKCR